MGTGLGRKPCEDHLHLGQIQQLVILAACDQPQARGQHIGQRSRIAIESIQANQDVLQWDRHLVRISDEHLENAQQFAPVIAIACTAKGSQKLMSMSLQDGGAGAHDFSPLASVVAFGAHPIKATMRSRQGLVLGQGTLASGLAGSIDIGNQPGLLAPILDPTGVSERSAGEQILLEQGTQAFHARLIECRKIP